MMRKLLVSMALGSLVQRLDGTCLVHDDIDGSDAIQTVRFALDGVEYEIDLSDRNADRLRNSLAEFERACSHGQESAWTHAQVA